MIKNHNHLLSRAIVLFESLFSSGEMIAKIYQCLSLNGYFFFIDLSQIKSVCVRYVWPQKIHVRLAVLYAEFLMTTVSNILDGPSMGWPPIHLLILKYK